MPRVHPIVNIMKEEWRTSVRAGYRPRWEAITMASIVRICQRVEAEHPDWHPDLYALDLSAYLRGLTKKRKWWLQEPKDSTSQMFLHLQLIFILLSATVDTQHSPSPQPPSPSGHQTVSSKGKAQEETSMSLDVPQQSTAQPPYSGVDEPSLLHPTQHPQVPPGMFTCISSLP
jgi:hypothetical protein